MKHWASMSGWAIRPHSSRCSFFHWLQEKLSRAFKIAPQAAAGGAEGGDEAIRGDSGANGNGDGGGAVWGACHGTD